MNQYHVFDTKTLKLKDPIGHDTLHDARQSEHYGKGSTIMFGNFDAKGKFRKLKMPVDPTIDSNRFKSESTELISAIVEGDTLTAARIFEGILYEKAVAKVEDKKKKVGSDIIALALKDKNIHVRMAAARNATDPIHHEMAMKDKHPHVKIAALNNPHLYAKPEEDAKKKKKSPIQSLISHIKKFKEEE